MHRCARRSLKITATLLLAVVLENGNANVVRCGLGHLPIVNIRLENETSGEFQVVSRRRRLRESHSVEATINLGQHRGLVLDNQTVYQARRCGCAALQSRKPDYCLVQFSECSVDTTGDQLCYNSVTTVNVVRGLVPVMLFFWCVIVYLFVVSEPGGAARSYIYRKVVSGCGRDVEKEEQVMSASVDRLEARNPERAAFLFHGALRRNRIARRAQAQREQRLLLREARRTRRRFGRGEHPVSERESSAAAESDREEVEEVTTTPNQLALRTRIYKRQEEPVSTNTGNKQNTGTSHKPSWNLLHQFKLTKSSDDGAMEDETQKGVRCAICLSLLETGDRVGDLECQHMFHVECLKLWLKRKNQCPLCNRDAVAEPRYCAAPTSHVEGGTTNDTTQSSASVTP